MGCLQHEAGVLSQAGEGVSGSVADSKRVLQPYNVNVLREKGVMLDKIF